MDLGVGTGSSEWRDGKEGGDGRKVKRAKEDDGMGEEGLLAAGWGSMDYGVSRAEQWRRRSINNSASEQRGGGDSLPHSRSRKSMLPGPTGRPGEVPLIAASCFGPAGGTKGHFRKVPLR